MQKNIWSLKTSSTFLVGWGLLPKWDLALIYIYHTRWRLAVSTKYYIFANDI